MTQTESGTKQEASANDSIKPPLSLPVLANWREELDMLSKALFIVVGGAYVVGLLILNAYVRQYGVHYMNFLQIEYVMAGIMWGFLTVVSACFIWFIEYRTRAALTNFRATKGLGKFKRTGHFGVAIFHMLVSLFAGLMSLFIIMRIVTDEALSWTNLVVWTSLLGAVLTTWFLVAMSGRLKEQVSYILSRGGIRDEPLQHVRETLFDVGYNVAVIVSGLSLYALMVFPNISSVYGGGKIQTADFIVKSDQLETVKFLGLSVNENSRMIGPLSVILESPDYFLIKPPVGYADKQVKAIRLKKDAVDAALYRDERIKK